MQRGAKISLSVVGWLLLGVAVAPLFASMLIYLPPVQRLAAGAATQWLSDMLGTKVTVGGIEFSPFSRLRLSDIYLEDQQGDTLIWGGDLRVGVESMGLLSGKVTLGRVTLKDGLVYLRERGPKMLNVSQIFDRIKKGEKKGGSVFRLDVASLDVENVRFRMEMLAKKPRGEGCIDFADLEVNDIVFRISDIHVVNDSVALRVDWLSFTEKSGFTLESLTSESFRIGHTGMRFGDTSIDTPLSHLRFERLNMLYDSWRGYLNFLYDVRFDARLLPESRLDFRTLGVFAPELQKWDIVARDLDADMQGPVRNMRGSLRNAVCDNSRFVLDYAIRGIPTVSKTVFDFDIHKIATTGGDLRRILPIVTMGKLDGKQLAMAERIDSLGVSGRFNGLIGDFRTAAAIETSDGGSMSLDMRVRATPQGRVFDGNVQADRLDLSKLADSDMLGTGSLRADVKGRLGGKFNLETDAKLYDLNFNGYTYSLVGFVGTLGNRLYKGTVTCDDPNMRLDAEGVFDLTGSTPCYDATMRLHHADLHRLNFNSRDSVSTLSCVVRANGCGTSLDELDGTATIERLLYVNHLDSVRTGPVVVRSESGSAGGGKRLTLTSNFADARLRSDQSYARLGRSLVNLLSYYIPSIEKQPCEAGGITALEVRIKQADNVAGIFMPGLRVAGGTVMDITLDAATEHADVSLRSDSIRLGALRAGNIALEGQTRGNRLTLNVDAAQLGYGRFLFPNFNINGSAREYLASLDVRYDDPERRTGASIGLRSRLDGGNATRPSRIDVELVPSRYVDGDRTWNISVRNISYESSRVTVDSFEIDSRGEGLSIGGVLSRSASDTLGLSLRNFDLSPLTAFAARSGYNVSATATGRADLMAGLGKGLLYADLNIDGMKVNHVLLPPLRLYSDWDLGSEAIRATLSNRVTDDGLVTGLYRPSDGSYSADLSLENIDLSLVDPVMKGVLVSTSGHADLIAHVTGRNDLPVVEDGLIEVRNMRTTVEFTGVPYHLTDASIEVENNVFSLNPVAVYDDEGNRATVDMALELGRFGNMQYELRARPERLLALNTTSREGEPFYGKVYASGLATVKGDRSGVKIDVTATTDDNSTFTVALGDKSDFAAADFVVFRSQKQQGVQQEQQQSARGNLTVNLALDVKPNTELQIQIDPSTGDGIRARGDGNISIHVAPSSGELTMYGDYVISEGTYLLTVYDPISRSFNIKPGSSIRSAGDIMAATLDVTGVYNTRASLAPLLENSSGGEEGAAFRSMVPVECEIILTERLSSPNILFNVNVPTGDAEIRSLVANAMTTQEMMATQFVWLLAIDSFYANNSGENNGANPAIGALATGAALGIDMALGRLSSMINSAVSNTVNFDIRFRQGTEISSDELAVGFQLPLMKNRLIIEADGNFDTGSNTDAKRVNTGGITGDAYLTYIIGKAGKLRAKAFSRTIDRYDENQGLQENGLGIYYSDDFNSFSELWRRIWRKKPVKKGQAKGTK
ncbi:MAG: translocation/assembly module TamB [Rikenellaceae bacterium]|jgi:hypothetical protein|nr:translocation/assembly module TamB [Rikenellaceae bacterium]